jgi:hypothetical protein
MVCLISGFFAGYLLILGLSSSRFRFFTSSRAKLGAQAFHSKLYNVIYNNIYIIKNGQSAAGVAANMTKTPHANLTLIWHSPMRSPYNEHGHEHSLIPYLKKKHVPRKNSIKNRENRKTKQKQLRTNPHPIYPIILLIIQFSFCQPKIWLTTFPFVPPRHHSRS